jgi:hypothetical protein
MACWFARIARGIWSHLMREVLYVEGAFVLAILIGIVVVAERLL